MKVVNRTNEKVLVELSPVEVLMVQKAVIREASVRNKIWSTLETRHLEEVLYHATLKDTSRHLKSGFGKVVHEYRKLGILK